MWIRYSFLSLIQQQAVQVFQSSSSQVKMFSVLCKFYGYGVSTSKLSPSLLSSLELFMKSSWNWEVSSARPKPSAARFFDTV